MRLSIERMAYGFDAVSHDEDGKTVFVQGGVPGDVVEAHVTSEGKTFSRAVIDEVLTPSPARVEPRCPYASACGGCPWSNMTYAAQLLAKRANVADALRRIGHLDAERVDSLMRDIVPSEQQWGYRNKAELAVVYDEVGGISLGMHARSDRGVVRVDECLLLPEGARRLPKSVRGALKFLSSSRELGLQRVGMRVSERTRQMEIALWTDPQAFPRQTVAKVLTDAAKPTSIARVLVKGDGAARKVARIERLAGKGEWVERVAGQRMHLSAPSFFQVNTAGAETLVNLVVEGLDVQDDDVACDLYCGAGTFTLPLARRAGGGVVAVESYGPAVRDLKRNVEASGLQDSVECIGDDAALVADVVDDADVIVVDPPRAGLASEVVEQLSECDARAVAYVSCDPATLARDLAAFARLGGLAPVSVTPVDLFPQTFHVETVVMLSRVSD
jgi:23S rRNA (uracil1939-C5)-methyltransferase